MEQAFAVRAAQAWTAPPVHAGLMREEARVRPVDRLETRLAVSRLTAFIGDGRPKPMAGPDTAALVLYQPEYHLGQTVWGPFGRGKVVAAGAGAVVVLYDRSALVSVDQGDFRPAAFTDAEVHTLSTKRTSAQRIRAAYFGESIKMLSLLSPEEKAERRTHDRPYLDIGTPPENTNEGVRRAYRAAVLRNRKKPQKMAKLAAAWRAIELERGLIQGPATPDHAFLSLAEAAVTSEIPLVALTQFLRAVMSMAGTKLLRDGQRHYFVPQQMIPWLRDWYNDIHQEMLAWLNDPLLAWEERVQCGLPLTLCDRLATLRSEGPFTDWFNFEHRWRAVLEEEMRPSLVPALMATTGRQLRHAFQRGVIRRIGAIPAEVKSAAVKALQTATMPELLKIFCASWEEQYNRWYYLPLSRGRALAAAIADTRPSSLRDLHTRGVVRDSELGSVFYRLFSGMRQGARARAAVATAG